tara:strand:+ start:187 stop:627 length:441 start_codon:yes stop_codon:yes gene_type:complete
MWHYAKIDENNIVINVMTINNQDGEDEAHGVAICEQLTGDAGPWIKGSHTDGLFRKVGPGRGMTWDPDRDGFIPKRPGPAGALWESWVIDETTLYWAPPIGYPDGYDRYTVFGSWVWDEENVAWISVPQIDLDAVPFPEGESRRPD